MNQNLIKLASALDALEKVSVRGKDDIQTMDAVFLLLYEVKDNMMKEAFPVATDDNKKE